ncbi:MAG: hypothetical protein HOO88_07480 [Kiritimatiellaceae bacterium]|nr:hypothetical protein [Kiritimatiellaceae bacterium]
MTRFALFVSKLQGGGLDPAANRDRGIIQLPELSRGRVGFDDILQERFCQSLLCANQLFDRASGNLIFGFPVIYGFDGSGDLVIINRCNDEFYKEAKSTSDFELGNVPL